MTEGISDGGVLIAKIFQLEEGERNSIHEDDDIGAAIGAIFDDGELIDGGPIVVFGLLKVEESDEVVNDAAFFTVFDVDAVREELMKATIAFFEARANDARGFADGIGDGLGGNFGIDAREGFLEAAQQQNLGIVLAFCEQFAGRDERTMDNRVA